jgi:hypothetical protein
MRDAAVRRWRRELESHGLDRSTVEELVVHFEAALDARLAGGDSITSAVDAARRDLGEPAAIAREHARVRSGFGPRPSRLTAWIAVSALITYTAIFLPNYFNGTGLLPHLFTGPAAMRTTAILALLVFRSPQAAAYLFGATASELSLLLANSLHTAVLAGDARGTAELVLLVGACAMLATRRPTRWYVSTAALGWTITMVNFYGVHLLGDLAAFAVPLLGGVAVLAVGARAKLAWPLCAAVCAVSLAIMSRDVAWLGSAWPSIPYWWQFDAVSWHAIEAMRRVDGALTLAAPVVAVAVLRGGRFRSTRDVFAAFRGNGSTPSGA